MPKTLAILGLGLMGGSLGLAAKSHGVVEHVTAYARREESRMDALRLGIADSVFDNPSDAVRQADVVVLCTPVLTMPDLVQSIKADLPEGCIVTDVGSTKGFLADALGAILEESSSVFVGSHPMAGSEKAGLDAAYAELYEGARVIVTSSSENLEATGKISTFWSEMGAEVSVMTPIEHDAVIGRTSHLPHLVAAALVNTIDRGDRDVAPLCGPGFLDTTRIAEGSELVWHDIVKTNAAAIRQELDLFSQEIDAMKALLDDQDFETLRSVLATCRKKRSRFAQ
jgi:prephenate dehydrogenase